MLGLMYHVHLVPLRTVQVVGQAGKLKLFQHFVASPHGLGLE